MANTTNYNLEKPSGSDYADIAALNRNADKLDAALLDLETGKADLGTDGKVPAGQLPEMNYDPAGSADAVKTKLTAHTENRNNPHGVTAAQVGAAAATHAAQHASGGSDPVTSESIGAAEVGHAHSATDVTSGTLDSARLPTVPVSKGGTGLTALVANRLIVPSATTTMAQLAFPSAAGSLLRQGTSGAPYWSSLANLVTEGGLAKIAVGSYTGTGTYGISNQCSITVGFAPKYVFVMQDDYTSSTHGLPHAIFIYPATIAPSSVDYDSIVNIVVTWMSTGLSWYNDAASVGASYQLNVSGKTYRWVAIG